MRVRVCTCGATRQEHRQANRIIASASASSAKQQRNQQLSRARPFPTCSFWLARARACTRVKRANVSSAPKSRSPKPATPFSARDTDTNAKRICTRVRPSRPVAGRPNRACRPPARSHSVGRRSGPVEPSTHGPNKFNINSSINTPRRGVAGEPRAFALFTFTSSVSLSPVVVVRPGPTRGPWRRARARRVQQMFSI